LYKEVVSKKEYATRKYRRKKEQMILENSYFRIGIGETNGAIESLLVKKTGCELIG